MKKNRGACVARKGRTLVTNSRVRWTAGLSRVQLDFQKKRRLVPDFRGNLILLSNQWSTGQMHRAHELNTSRTELFDSRGYLLTRYGLRMNKKEVCFEAKKSRATIDNMRNPRHRSFDRRLVNAQVDTETEVENWVPVIFRTTDIADWLDGIGSARGC